MLRVVPVAHPIYSGTRTCVRRIVVSTRPRCGVVFFFFCILFFSVHSFRRVTLRTQVAPIFDLSMERVVQRCIVPLLFLKRSHTYFLFFKPLVRRSTFARKVERRKCQFWHHEPLFSVCVICAIACESVL